MAKIGIIGVGGIGSAHFNCIISGKVDGLYLGAVCDTDPARLDYCRSLKPDVPIFTDYRDMIKNGLIDSVLVSVPHPLHAEISICVLRAGLNVLTEKPEDISVSAASALNNTAARYGKVFGIMFNQRTNPIYRKAREIVRSGALGELKRSIWIITNWYRTQHYYDSGSWRATWAGEGGGVLLNQAPHNLDLWQWICGMPSELTAFCEVGRWHNIEVEDEASIFCRYKNGASGVFITSTGDLPGTNRLEITGTLGQIIIEHGRLTYKKLQRDEREICFSEKKSWPEPDTETEIFEPSDLGSAHQGILQNFANAVNSGEALIAPGQEGINELILSNAAYLSDWTKRTVSLPLSEEDINTFDSLLKERRFRSHLKPLEEKQTHSDYNGRWSVKF